MGNVNCREIVEENLLRDNALYRFRWSFAIILAIIVTAMCQTLKMPGFISGLFIPLGTVFLAERILDFIARQNLDRSKITKMVTTCDEQITNLEQKIQQTVQHLPDVVHADNVVVERFGCAFNSKKDKETFETFKNNEFDLLETLDDKQASSNIVPNNIGCMMPNDPCQSLCSGSGQNPCNVVAPVPGPQWQPQSASVVQARLENGQYVPTNCLSNN